MNKKIFNTNKAPLSTSPVAQANIINNTIYIGGQMPRDMETNLIVEGGLNQTEKSMEHCLTILKDAGFNVEDVVFATVYVTDLSVKSFVNQVFERVFVSNPPARNLVAVKDIGENALIEIALIASK